jgi:hypothetical protein
MSLNVGWSRLTVALSWLHVRVQIVKDETGRPIILRGVMIDITQSKNTAAELQKHHQEIQSLQEISQIILEATEPNAGIQKALERCVTVGGFDFGDILLTTPEGEFVSVVAAYGFSDPANLQRTRRRRASTHRREHLQQSSIIHNMQVADRFRSLKPEGAETAVIVPLRAGDHSLGLLQLVSRRAKVVRPYELALAEAMGRQIGIAIQKAKLTDDLQINLRRVNTLYECNVALNSTLDVRAVLEILLDKMDFFPSRNAVITIQLIDSETGRLEYFANRNLDEQAWIREFGGDRNISAAGLTKYTIESSVPVVIQDLCSDRRVRHPSFFAARECSLTSAFQSGSRNDRSASWLSTAGRLMNLAPKKSVLLRRLRPRQPSRFTTPGFMPKWKNNLESLPRCSM